jgi:hypothetical protein
MTKTDLTSKEPRQSHANLIGCRMGAESDQSNGDDSVTVIND